MASEYNTLLAIQQHGDLNPSQRTRLQELQSQGPPSPEPSPSPQPTGDKTYDYLMGVVKQVTDQMSQHDSRFNEYTQNNPFNMDEVLKEEQGKVKERLDPYYTQTLNDFLTGINIKKTRSLEDNQRLLGEINQSIDRYTGQQKEQLAQTLDSTGQSFASQGLYDSGARARTQGNEQLDSNQAIQNYTIPLQQQAQTSNINTQRTVGQDLPLQQQIEQRNLGQEEQYNVEAQAIPQEQQRQSQWEFARQNYAGNYPGVIPSQGDQANYKILTG